MFKINIDSGNKNVNIQIDKNTFLVKGGIRKAFHQMGKQFKSYANKEILDKTKKHGRLYYFTKTVNGKKGERSVRVKHRASAAGEYPANRTGNLRRALNFNVVGSNKLIWGDRAFYAKWLEDGTFKMGARPFLKMTIEANRALSIKYLDTAVRKALTKGKK